MQRILFCCYSRRSFAINLAWTEAFLRVTLLNEVIEVFLHERAFLASPTECCNTSATPGRMTSHTKSWKHTPVQPCVMMPTGSNDTLVALHQSNVENYHHVEYMSGYV